MKWYKQAIGYEIYPYSFMDSDGDGYGDLPGVIAKLDYLSDLGVTLIWLCPIYESPMDDYGYDVSDFYEVNPLLGNNSDLQMLLKEAHKRGIRVIMDLVMNHVSAEHEWFKKAINDPYSPYHDYFIFRKPKYVEGKPKEPNNWMGFFSESVWTYVPEIDEYYFHIFSSKMPDLNWENPELREEMYNVARYYLDMGVDGFRMDAIAHLAKDQSFEDSSYSTGPVLDTTKFSNRERLFDYLAEFKREVLDKYEDVLTVGEVGGEASTQTAIRYASRQNGSLSMVFNFDTCWENGAYGSMEKSDDEIRVNLVQMKKLFKKWYDACHGECDMPLYWVNHDHPRVVSQYGNLNFREKSAKMLGTVLLFMYGTPFIFQGEELGMTNVSYDTVEDFFADVDAVNLVKACKDVPEEVLLRFLRRCSRVNARTPMQWTDDVNAGFTTGKPHIKVNSNYHEINVKQEKNDSGSVLNHYRKAIALRKKLNRFVVQGSFEIPDIENDDLFIYTHALDGQEIMVVANFHDKQLRYEVEGDWHILLSNEESVITENSLNIDPYGCFLLKK